MELGRVFRRRDAADVAHAAACTLDGAGIRPLIDVESHRPILCTLAILWVAVSGLGQIRKVFRLTVKVGV
jgi:hypothetical protein